MEDKIEREWITLLEKKKEQTETKKLSSQKPINYQMEDISTLNNQDMYSMFCNQQATEIKLLQKRKIKKAKLYNHLIGEYQYRFHTPIDDNKNTGIILHKQTHISSLLKENELIGQITYNNTLPPSDENNFYPVFFKYLDSYRDIHVNNNNWEIRTEMLKLYLFHIINHVLKRKEDIEVNDRIDKIINDSTTRPEELIKKELFVSHEEEFIEKYHSKTRWVKGENDKNKNGQIIQYTKETLPKYTPSDWSNTNIRDQGFTYPKVLIWVPYKKHARVIIEEIVSIFYQGNWKGINNKKKFKDEYSEFDSLSDCFRIGLNFSFFDNKLKLYTPFDESDIIIASPLGLKLSTSNSTDSKTENKGNVKVYDFLSSIEILWIDFSEVFLYQNMEHLNEVLSYINKHPKNNQNIVSIDRIKESFIENLSPFLRQTILINHFKALDLDVLMNEFSTNINGCIRIDCNYDNQVEWIKNELRETYPTLPSKDYEIRFEFKMWNGWKGDDDYDDKFNYFTKNVWNNWYESFDKHTIIFVASPWDYLRWKSFYKQTSKSVLFINEDTDKKDWQRHRWFFEEGKYKFLLYSERGHFYKKLNLKFAKNIFFYSLPEDPKIFKEMIEWIDPIKYKENITKYKWESTQSFGSVIALVSPIEKYCVEKILGHEGRAMVLDKKEYYAC